MKVYIVLAYPIYYPSGDNIQGIYFVKEDAYQRAEEIRVNSRYDHIEVVEKVIEG